MIAELVGTRRSRMLAITNIRKDKAMTDLRWEHYAEQKREEMIDEIYESLPMIHANKGDLELKSVISHVDASYDDWERFINKEDITEVIQEYMSNLASKFN